jgi:hypothetical protein
MLTDDVTGEQNGDHFKKMVVQILQELVHHPHLPFMTGDYPQLSIP